MSVASRKDKVRFGSKADMGLPLIDVRFTAPKADIAEYDWDVRFVPIADIRVRGWGGKEPGGRHLFGVVKDDSDGVTHPGTNAAHAVPKVDAIRSFRPFYRPVMHGERNRITLLQWHHFHAALHTWPLF